MSNNLLCGHVFLALSVLTSSIAMTVNSNAASSIESSFKNGGSGDPSHPDDDSDPPDITDQLGTNHRRPTTTPLGRRGGRCNDPESYVNLPDLTILSPSDESRANTRQALPTFLVYTPVDITEESPASLILAADTGIIATIPIDVASGNSIVPVTLPEQESALLEVGESYTVIFRVYCQNSDKRPSRNTIADRSTVTRIASTDAQEAWYDDIVQSFNELFDTDRESWNRRLVEEGLEEMPDLLSEEELEEMQESLPEEEGLEDMLEPLPQRSN